jgi:hypothetical protein
LAFWRDSPGVVEERLEVRMEVGIEVRIEVTKA